MCSEGKPEACHRTKLVATELVATGVPVVHIDQHGQLRRHEEIIDLITGRQEALFGAHAATSTSSRRRSDIRE